MSGDCRAWRVCARAERMASAAVLARKRAPAASSAPRPPPPSLAVAAGVAGQASSLARGPVSISVNQPGSAASILSAAPPSSTSRDRSLSLLTLVIPNSIAARICVRESKMSVFLATAAAAAAAESVLSGSREASRVFQSSGEVGAGSGCAPSAFLILAQASFASRARRSRLSLSSCSRSFSFSLRPVSISCRSFFSYCRLSSLLGAVSRKASSCSSVAGLKPSASRRQACTSFCLS